MIRSFATAVIMSVIMSSSISCIPVLNPSTEPVHKKIVEPDEEELKKNGEQIKRFYGDLNIRLLDHIPESEYADYAKFAQNRTAYVIVHPSYFVFFHNYDKKDKVVVEREEGDYSRNIVDIFIEDYPAKNIKALMAMKESAWREKEFLKKASSMKKLVILVLPPDYLKHPEYPYRKLDEFGRYLNEVTGGSPSVVYVESESFKRGNMTFDSFPRLNRFLKVAGVNSVFIGGGYMGLCQKNFYDEATNLRDIERIEIVREISTESPEIYRSGI